MKRMVPSRGLLRRGALLAALCSAGATASHHHKHSQRHPQRFLLRHRTLETTEAEAEKEKTNDDDHTIIDLYALTLRLTNVPTTSPLAIVKDEDSNLNSEEVDSIIGIVEEMGAEVLEGHPVYGERFREWSVGEAWTSDYVLAPATDSSAAGGAGGSALPSPGEGSLPAGAELSRSEIFDRKRMLRTGNVRKLQESAGEATVDEVAPLAAGSGPETATDAASSTAADTDTADDNSQETTAEAAATAEEDPSPPAPKQTGTTTLTLPSGSVTFNGAYWEDDPDPLELTAYLVDNLDEGELLVQLWPLVCSAEEIAEGECDVGVEVVSDAVEEMKEAGSSGAGEGAQDGSGGGDGAGAEQGANASEGSQEGEGNTTGDANGSTTDKGTVPEGPTVDGAGEAQDPSQGEGSNDDNLKIIIPVAVGAALLAFILAGLLYRRRKQRQDDEAEEDLILKTVGTEDTPDELSNAYDAITGGKKDAAAPSPSSTRTAAAPPAAASPVAATTPSPSTTRTAAASPVAAVAAGAAIATAAAVATASQKQTSKDIDNILEDFSDADSSFVSESSGATSEANGNDASVTSLSGLSGILTDGSPTLTADVAMNESKLSYSADTTAIKDGSPTRTAVEKDDDDEAGAGYLPKSLKESGIPSKAHRQKQEQFEDNYRTRSAMAKLNLKKDMLHVACEAHDAGESTAPTDDAVESAGNGGYMHEAGMGYGVTRTISPKKSATMMEKQRLAEKLSLRPGKKGRRRREKEAEDALETSTDLILPANFHRSDSDGAGDDRLGTRVDSGSEEEDDDESGSFV